ncbi:MAG: four helix bundle protein [Chloroflexi bacterium RBG_19FT_COMBO_62_14]|nr:MAG: four helix bundle protein [Chloroflexi bacterium RBG_19FT_COMBO_62_14]
MKDFRQLKTWHKAHALVLMVYEATRGFPKEELYGLTTQTRRAAVSIPANIAEGCGRGGNAELGRFLQIAMGSTLELEYHLLLAKDLGYLTEEKDVQLRAMVHELKSMLSTLIRKVKVEAQ